VSTRTPDDVLTELRWTRTELMKGSDALKEAELNAERAEEAAQLAFDKVLMTAEGSIPDKQALARAASTEERDVAFIARAEYNRVKSKIRGWETSLVSYQAELKWMRDEGA
jgi:hypothetical protein